MCTSIEWTRRGGDGSFKIGPRLGDFDAWGPSRGAVKKKIDIDIRAAVYDNSRAVASNSTRGPKSQRLSRPPPPRTPPIVGTAWRHRANADRAAGRGAGLLVQSGPGDPFSPTRSAAGDPFPDHRCRVGLVPRQSLVRCRAITSARPFSVRFTRSRRRRRRRRQVAVSVVCALLTRFAVFCARLFYLV